MLGTARLANVGEELRAADLVTRACAAGSVAPEDGNESRSTGTPDPIGFDAVELERLLTLTDGKAASDEAEDEVPDPPENPITRPGDVWIVIAGS